MSTSARDTLVLFNTSNKHNKITRPPSASPRDTCFAAAGLSRQSHSLSVCFVSSLLPLCPSMPRWSLLPAGLRLYSTARCPRRWLSTSPPASAEPSRDPSHRWGNTILLPKTSFPLYNDASKDAQVRAKTSGELYQWQVGERAHRPASKQLTLYTAAKRQGPLVCLP